MAREKIQGLASLGRLNDTCQGHLDDREDFYPQLVRGLQDAFKGNPRIRFDEFSGVLDWLPSPASRCVPIDEEEEEVVDCPSQPLVLKSYLDVLACDLDRISDRLLTKAFAMKF